MASHVSSQPVAREVEVYHCGCKVRFYRVDYGEAKHDLLERPMLVSDYSPCSRHKHAHRIPPGDARLVTVRGERESFLNE